MIPEDCKSRIDISVERRPANALNIEIGSPRARCMNKKPAHWPEASTAARWIGSGGSPLVFGPCSADCPLTQRSHKVSEESHD